MKHMPAQMQPRPTPPGVSPAEAFRFYLEEVVAISETALLFTTAVAQALQPSQQEAVNASMMELLEETAALPTKSPHATEAVVHFGMQMIENLRRLSPCPAD
jgi:hypothetical protein